MFKNKIIQLSTTSGKILKEILGILKNIDGLSCYYYFKTKQTYTECSKSLIKLYNSSLIGLIIFFIGILFLACIDIITNNEFITLSKIKEINGINEITFYWIIISSGLIFLKNFGYIVIFLDKCIFKWQVNVTIFCIILAGNKLNILGNLLDIFPILILGILLVKVYSISIDRKNSNTILKRYLQIFNESGGNKGKFMELYKNLINDYLEDSNEGNIYPIKDNPISYKSEDMFGYNNIAKNIYNLIRGININNGSYSIGIIGEWGLGKSSIIGILKESKLKLDPNIIIHDFNPWNFTKSDLINSFIREISIKVNRKDLTKLFIEYIETLAGIHSTTSIVFKLIKNVFGKEKTIEEIREEISEELIKLDKKLLIIIDDLDRCEPDEIITMLNVVKNIGNFNNVIYLISFDKIHIIEALKEKGFHEDYIDKIINTEIHIPMVSKESKIVYFKKQLRKILQEIKITNEIIEGTCKIITEEGNTGLDEIFEKENLRFIKKLLNKVNVSLKLVFNTVTPEITELDADNIAYIVLINYIKIKDLELFNDSINKKLSIMQHEIYERHSPNIPKIYIGLKHKKIQTKFLKEIIGLQVSIGGEKNDELTIRNISFDESKKDMIKRNFKLLKDFS